MFDILLVRRHGNRKNNDGNHEDDVTYIFNMELVLKGMKSGPHGIKEMPDQIEKPFECEMEFLRKCIAEMNGIGE